MISRLRFLWKDPVADGTELESDPGQNLLRTWILAIALVLIPPLVVLLYYRAKFTSLVGTDALEYAHVARNLIQGKGLVTQVLRPLTIVPGEPIQAQPLTQFGPFFPLMLALAFGVMGARDNVSALVSSGFYLGCIPVIYALGLRAFSRPIALIATIAFVCSSTVLEAAISGTPTTALCLFFCSLLLVLVTIYRRGRGRAPALHTPDEAEGAVKPVVPTRAVSPLPRGYLVLAGLLMSALYLTDPVTIFLFPVTLWTVAWLEPQRRARAVTWFTAPAILLMLPWLMLNAQHTGNPLLGHRGLQFWFADPQALETAYRLTPQELRAPSGLVGLVLTKIVLGVRTLTSQYPAYLANWPLLFAAPGFIIQAQGVTAFTRALFLWLFLSMALLVPVLRLELQLFLIFLPVILLVSAWYFVHLLRQPNTSRIAGGVAIAATLVMAVLPVLSGQLGGRELRGPRELSTATLLGRQTRQGEIVLTDQPALVAWYTGAPALLIPQDPAYLAQFRSKNPGLRWLFLTGDSRGFSQELAGVHDVFLRWNLSVVEAVRQNQKPPPSVTIDNNPDPMLRALQGFTTFPILEQEPTSAAVGVLEQPRNNPPARPRSNRSQPAPRAPR